jgi:ubiquinone/menaquinone biosynthesis C-methylase UbiE
MVLDIGCNTGNAARYIKEMAGCKIVGVDFPESWMGTCRIERCLRADAHYLPFKEGIFDKAYMLHVLGHVKFPDMILKEVLRVLKPGGSFFMINPNKYFVYSMRPLNYAGIIRYNPDKTVLRYYSKKDMGKMIKNARMTLSENMTFGDLPPYLKKCEGLKVLNGLRERLFTLARK